MTKSYHKGRHLAALLPSIKLLEASRVIAEGAMIEIGRLTLETILGMSAAELAGEPQRGKRKGSVRHHGSQPGSVRVAGKRDRLDRPRLRDKENHEVAVPAYSTLKEDPKSADRALGRVLAGISVGDL